MYLCSANVTILTFGKLGVSNSEKVITDACVGSFIYSKYKCMAIYSPILIHIYQF